MKLFSRTKRALASPLTPLFERGKSKAEIFGLKILILCLMFLIGILIFPKFVFAANITFTLETWLKPATSVATKAILVKNNEMRLVTDGDGNPSCQIYSTDWQTAAVSSAAISTGSWQHVACTYDGTNIKVYVGGTLTDTEAETADVNDTANGMQVGNGTDYNKFEGQIDSVRIFNRALSANEIKAHYDLGNLAQDSDMEDGDVAEFSQASEGSELLSNTGFETVTGDDFGSWTESVGDGAVASSTTVHAGTYALKATAGVSANSYAKQAAAVTAGKMYKLTFWTRGDATYGGRYKIYDATGAADIVALGATAVTGTTYAQITKYFTAPAGCASAEIYLYCPSTNTGISYFDDVSIVEAQTASAESGTVADEDGLVGGWNFEDNATDVSGNGNTGTVTNATYSSSGRFGKALNFDGDGDYAQVTYSASLEIPSTITVSAWVKGAAQNSKYIINRYGTDRVWLMSTGTNSPYGKMTVALSDNGTASSGHFKKYESSIAAFDSNWHYLSFTFNAGTLKLYVDGVEDTNPTKITDDAITTLYTCATENLYMGINYAGLIDSASVYNRVLSASEIAAHYSLGRGKHDNYAAKIKLAANDSNSYLDETLTSGQDYLASFWYHPGEDNANAIRFKISGSADPIMAEHNLMASSAMGLVGAWNFEDSLNDISGNGLNLTGTNIDSADYNASGKFGDAIDMDGSTEYLSSTSSGFDPGTNDWSTEFWVKRGATGTISLGIYNGSALTTIPGYFIGLSASDKIYAYAADGSSYIINNQVSSSSITSTTARNHIIWTVDRDGYSKFYLNGISDGTPVVINNSTNLTNAVDFVLGAYSTLQYKFNGLIDSVRIYNRALTASEVYDRYKAGDWHKYELSFEADQTGAHLFKFIQDGSTSGNSIVYVDNFRVDKNLANKGGFEAFAGGDPNIPTGWSATTDGLEAGEGIDEATEIHTGAKSFELIDADDGEGIKQAITVESGKWYTLSIWAKNNNQDVEAVISGAATDTIDLTTANNAWYKSNKTYLSNSTSLTVQIQAGAANQDGFFDDISLIELDSYTGATTAATTTPTVAASSYGKGRWGEASGAIMIDGGDTLAYPTANNIYADEGTVAFWVKPGMDYNDFSENKYLWSVEGVARLYYNYSDYKFYFEIYDGSAWDSVQAVSSAQTFTEDTWLHISASWNDRKNLAYLYINGTNDGSSTWGWYAQTLPTNMYFGAEYDGTNNADMYFDDVRVYDHALSAEDAHRMYGSSPDPSASELRLQIPFTYGGGTGIGVNGTGLYDLTGTFTAGWGYKPGKVSGEYALGFFGSDNLQFSRGDQVDGYVYEYITPYQGTIKTWVKPAFDGAEASTNVIFQNGSSNYVKLYNSSGALYWDIYDGTTTHRVSNDVSDWTAGTWYHVAAVWSNENTVSTSSTQYLMELYVNGGNGGNSYSNATFNTNFWAAFAPGTSYVGEDSSAANKFNGLIGGFAIDNRAWSGSEVLTDYNGGSGTAVAIQNGGQHFLPADSSDADGSVRWHQKNYREVTAGEIFGGWNFESNLTDASGNGNTAVLVADATYSTSGKNGSALSLDGTGDYAGLSGAISGFDFTNGLSVSLWLKTSTAADDGIISKSGLSDFNGDFFMTMGGFSQGAGKIEFGINNGDATEEYVYTASAYNDNNWHYVVGTYDKTNLKIYVDGVLRATQAQTADVANLSSALKIGAYYSSSYTFSGLIDSLSLYNRALTADEVAAYYDLGNYVADGNMEDGDAAEWSESANGYTSAEGGTAAPEDGLLGGWNYEDDLTDASGNSKNGTLHTDPDCPTGYVFVPGNSAYSTSDFCVMQYEAKYDSNDDGTGDDAPSSCKYNTNYDTWDWGKDVATGCGYNVNEAARVVSTAAGSPIAGITHTQALTACPAGDHIITNDEWMTIARDIEQVNANWTNGTVGSGCLFRGNSGETTCGYDGADPEKGTGRNARAKFTLSSGEEIYDISGNVWEHVKVDGSDTLISLAEQPEATSDGTNPISDADAFNWSDFTTGGGLSRWLLNNGTEPPLGYDVFRPSNSSWNASQGMGRIYHSSNSANATKVRVFLRGGNWNNETIAGAFTLLLIWNASGQYYSVGFRCAR